MFYLPLNHSLARPCIGLLRDEQVHSLCSSWNQRLFFSDSSISLPHQPRHFAHSIYLYFSAGSKIKNFIGNFLDGNMDGKNEKAEVQKKKKRRGKVKKGNKIRCIVLKISSRGKNFHSGFAQFWKKITINSTFLSFFLHLPGLLIKTCFICFFRFALFSN